MAEPDIKVLVGVEGGGSVDGASGKEILKDLQNVAKEISNNKKLEVVINVDVKKTTDNFKKQLENALKHVKLNASTIIDVDDGKKRIATFGASVQSAIDSMAKDVIKRSEAVKKSLDTMTDGDFSTFKDSLASIQKESEKLVASVDKIDTMADLSNILDQFDALEKRIRNIQKAASHKSAAFVNADNILNFVDSIDGKSIGTVQNRIAEVRTEVATLLQTLNVTDDTTIIDSVTNRLNKLGEELIQLRSQANEGFDFDTEFNKLTTSAENAIRKIQILKKSDLLGDNSAAFDDIENKIRTAISDIGNAGSAEVFANSANIITEAIGQIERVSQNIKFDHLSDTGFAAFNRQLGNAKHLLNQISSSKYDNAIDIIGAEENAELQKAITLISQLSTKHAGGAAFSSYDEYTADLNALSNAFTTVRNAKQTLDTSLRNTGWALQERQNFNVLTNSVQRYYDTYKDNISKIPSLNASFTSLLSKLEIPSNFKGGIKEARIEFSNLRREFQLTGGESQTLMQRLQALFGSRLGGMAVTGAIYALQNGLRQTVKHVIDINTSMTELRKVSNSSADALGEFFDRTREKAVDLSTEITTLIDATANFSRLGYGLQEAETLGEWATILANVADGMNSIDDATDSMISTMAAFRIESDKAYTVVDKFNKIGNEFPISTAGTAEALKRSASALAEASNSIDESMALIASANSVVQNPESVGTTLKTLSLRMRSAKVDLEDAGEESEGAAESIADLRKEILALTNQRVDIMVDDDTFKSTYKMLEEISAVWDDINDVDRAALLELIAGKRNANVAAAIINNFDMAREALNASLNAEGSAMQEYEVWMESIQAKTQQFTAQFQSLSGALIEQDWIKDVVDLGTGLLKILTDLTEASGSIPLIATAFGSFATFKNIGIFRVLDDFEKNGFKLGITDFIEDIASIFKKDRTISEVGVGWWNSILDSVFGMPTGMATQFSSEKAFENFTRDFSNAMDKGEIGSFLEGAIKNGTISKNTADAMTDLFKEVDVGSVSFERASKHIDLYNQNLIKSHRSVMMAKASATLLSGALNVLASIAVGLAINGIAKLIKRKEEAQKAANDLSDTYQENVKSLEGSIRQVEGLRSEFESLSKGVNDRGENVSLSNEEFERYLEIANEIASLSPDLVIGYDAEGNAILNKNNAIDQTIDKLKEQIELEEALLLMDKDTYLEGKKVSYDKTESDYNNARLMAETHEIANIESQIREIESQRDAILSNVFEDNQREYYTQYYDGVLKDLQTQLEIAERNNGSEYQAILASVRKYQNQMEEQSRQTFNELGTLILEANSQYSSDGFGDDLRNITDRIARESINAFDENIRGDGAKYEAALNGLVSEIATLNGDQRDSLISAFNLTADGKTFKEYTDEMQKYISGIGDLPGETEEIEMKVALALDYDQEQVNAIIEDVKEKFGYDLSKDPKNNKESLLSGLTFAQMQIVTHPDFVYEIDENTTAEELGGVIQEFADKHPLAPTITFSIANYSDNIDKAQEKIESLRNALQSLNKGELTSNAVLDLMQQFPELIPYVDFAAQGFGRLGEGLRNALSGANDGLIEKLNEDLTVLKEAAAQAFKVFANASAEDRGAAYQNYFDAERAVSNMETIIDAAEKMDDAVNDATGSLNELQSAYDTLASVVKEYNTNGTVTLSTLESLLEVDDDYITALELTETGLKLNADAMNELAKAKLVQTMIGYIDNMIEEAKQTDNTVVAVDTLTDSVNELTEAKLKAKLADVSISPAEQEAILSTAETFFAMAEKIVSGGGSLLGSSSSTDAWKDEFERYLSDLEFMRDTNKITEQQYYAELNRLNEKYFANNKKYLDDYRKYYVEVYDYLLQRQEDMLNAIADAATKALDKQIEAKDKEIAARQELIDAKRDEISALEEQYEKEDRLFELQKARDNYNKIAANKNTRLYTRDKGWIYTADPHALQEAKDKLDELEKENERAEAKEAIEDEIKALEEEIKVLEDEKEAIEALKDKWGEATDSIGQSLEEYMLDLELTTAFTKMSYEQMSNAVMQYAAIVNAVRGGKLYGNGLAGFENIYGAANTAPLYGLTNSVAASAPTVGGTTTGAANVKEEETNPNTGAGGKTTGIRAYIESKSSSNISKETDKETEELLKLNTDTEKNTSNTYDANVQLIRLEEDAFVMVEDSFMEQYDLSNALYNTTLEDLENAYDTNEGVWSIFELFETLMEEGIRGLGGGSGGGSSGIRGFIESGGLDDGGGSSSGGSGKKSTHDRIAYADMDSDQRARAERMSERLGIPVEEIKMYDVGDNGLIIVGKDQSFTEDRQMVIKGWADKVADIDDDMRQEYRDTLEEQSKWDLTHVYATLSGKATGALSIGRRGLYNVDERGIETIVHPENGRVTWLEQGDRVYTANDTKRNYDMMDLFDRVDNLELLKKTVFDNPMERIVASLNRMPRTNPIQAIPVNQTVERDSDIYISGCEFNMPNVTDRESFIKDLTRIAKYK